MSQTFTYNFTVNGQSDTITVTTADTATTVGSGTGYAITGVSGTIDGQAITGLIGTGGQDSPDPSGSGGNIDDTIFINGGSVDGSGSSYGIDGDGIALNVGGDEWNLYDGGDGQLIAFDNTNGNEYPVTVEAGTQAPCYCPGTRILTVRGEVAVERLSVGDLILTASGEARPIKWIGRRSYAGRFANNNPDVLPIRFKAGSLGENLPVRDLWVSPNHAMYLDDVLIPATLLVNSVSVIRAAWVDEVAYYHVELETHDLLVADGTPAESYLDDDSRQLFHNAHEYAGLYGNAQSQSARYCAPRVEAGRVLEQVRQRIALRAGLAMQSGALAGAVERAHPHGVSGWAQDLSAPEAPVCLDVFVDSILATQVLADRYRPDLAGVSATGNGFSVCLSGKPAGRIEVRRSMDGALVKLALAVVAAA